MDNKNQNLVDLRFSVYELDKIIIALISNIDNKEFYKNVRTLFSRFNEESYKTDAEKDVRVYIINQIVSAVMSKNLDNSEVLLSTLDLSGKYYEKATVILNKLAACTNSIYENKDIDKKISDQLKFAVIENKTDTLIRSVNAIKSETYDNLGSEISNIENNINEINHDFKNYRETIEENNNTVGLEASQLTGIIKKVLDTENNPSSKVRTGIKLFNDILGGGYRPGRLYIALGLPKGWKSGFLLNSALWAKQYNTLKPKDPTKKPIILYITLENTMEQTVLRLMDHCKGDEYMKNLTSVTPQDIIRTFEENNIASASDTESSIFMMYKANKSITVEDISTIIDDYNRNGKEVVFLIIDYLKRLRPLKVNKELRFDLGDISNDLSTLAKDKDIPILSAMQLNRPALSAVEQAGDDIYQAQSALDKIGGSNTGESLDIVQNADCVFTLAILAKPVVDEETNIKDYNDRWLNIKIVASRDRLGSPVTNFWQRFTDDNGMKLIEDANADVSTSILRFNKDDDNRPVKTRGKRVPV